MARDTRSIEQQIFDTKLKIARLEDDLQVQLIYEQMPKYGAEAESYSYNRSNMYVANCAPENWLRAVIKHLNERLKYPMHVELVESMTAKRKRKQ